MLKISYVGKFAQIQQGPYSDSSLTKIFTWQACKMYACIREDYIECEFTRTLSNDRHPAGRHSVFDGMMEVFGDWISKISQIDRWRLKLRSCCDQCLSNFLATKSPLKESRKNIRLFNRNLRVTKEHQRANRSNS